MRAVPPMLCRYRARPRQLPRLEDHPRREVPVHLGADPLGIGRRHRRRPHEAARQPGRRQALGEGGVAIVAGRDPPERVGDLDRPRRHLIDLRALEKMVAVTDFYVAESAGPMPRRPRGKKETVTDFQVRGRESAKLVTVTDFPQGGDILAYPTGTKP